MKKLVHAIKICIAQQYFFFLQKKFSAIKAIPLFYETLQKSLRSIPFKWRILKFFSRKSSTSIELLALIIYSDDSNSKRISELCDYITKHKELINKDIVESGMRHLFNRWNCYGSRYDFFLSESDELKRFFTLCLQYIQQSKTIQSFADYFIEQYEDAKKDYRDYDLYNYGGLLTGAIIFYRELGDKDKMLVCAKYLRKSYDGYFHYPKLHELLNLYIEIGLEQSKEELMEIVSEIEEGDKYKGNSICHNTFFAMYCRSLFDEGDDSPIWQLSSKLPLYEIKEKTLG